MASLTAALLCLMALGVVKSTAAAYGIAVAITGNSPAGAPDALRRLVAVHPTLIGTAAAAWYVVNGAFAFTVALGLHRRRAWAQWAALVYGGLHAFGFAGLLLLGPIVLLNGVLGIAIAVLVVVSGARGAFVPGLPAQAPSADPWSPG